MIFKHETENLISWEDWSAVLFQIDFVCNSWTEHLFPADSSAVQVIEFLHFPPQNLNNLRKVKFSHFYGPGLDLLLFIIIYGNFFPSYNVWGIINIGVLLLLAWSATLSVHEHIFFNLFLKFNVFI